jgi:hypothetical protein
MDGYSEGTVSIETGMSVESGCMDLFSCERPAAVKVVSGSAVF